ncbi:MAG: LLM class flavin-dependent oxidoreductase [Pseudomonadales bacterium]
MALRVAVIAEGDHLDRDGLLAFVRRIETLGYESFWIPELFGREPVATAGWLLGRTERISIATGIANVYVRDPHAMALTRRTLAELSDGRFLLGLGVSNPGLNQSRGHIWEAPLPKMRGYLEAMAKATMTAPEPQHPAPLHIAAHGPGLQRLGAEQADGIITYLMPPEHTVSSRARIGTAASLSVVCPFLAEDDPDTARRKARKGLRYYLTLDYYHREWQKLGFDGADFKDGGSDRLIDTLVAWGDEAALRKRVAAYEAAGADRVIVMPFDGNRTDGGDSLSLLAPG